MMVWKQFTSAVQSSPLREDAVECADLTWLVVVVQFLPQWFILPMEEGQLERFIDGAWRNIHTIIMISSLEGNPI